MSEALYNMSKSEYRWNLNFLNNLCPLKSKYFSLFTRMKEKCAISLLGIFRQKGGKKQAVCGARSLS